MSFSCSFAQKGYQEMLLNVWQYHSPILQNYNVQILLYFFQPTFNNVIINGDFISLTVRFLSIYIITGHCNLFTKINFHDLCPFSNWIVGSYQKSSFKSSLYTLDSYLMNMWLQIPVFSLYFHSLKSKSL